MGLRAKLRGTGMCVPDRVVTNDDLAARMDTNDEWIQKRSGIRERRHIVEGETPIDLAQVAAEKALASAGFEASDIDGIILATLSAHADFPGTSFFLHGSKGTPSTSLPDWNSCAGRVRSMSQARCTIKRQES